MSEQFRVPSPDFNLILKGNERAVHNAIRLLWTSLNVTLERVDRRRLIWNAVPYASGLFAASAGTWTVASGDMNLYRYVFADRLLLVSFSLENTTTSSGMGTSLYLDLPLNLSAQNTYNTGFTAIAGNIDEIGAIVTRSGANNTTLDLTRAAGSSWPSSVTDDLDIRGMIAIEI